MINKNKKLHIIAYDNNKCLEFNENTHQTLIKLVQKIRSFA